MEKEKKEIKSKKIGSSPILWLLIGAAIIFPVIFFVTPHPTHTSGFENIKEIVADANSKEELAAPESLKDHRRPSFKTYYNKTEPNFIKRKLDSFFTWLGINKRPFWSASYFKYLLRKRIQEREAKGLSSKYEYVNRIVPKESSRIIVWGDLTGAYHSMVRDLEKLIKLGVIDENLKLKSKDDYIALMGDVAARSPFIMELLTLIMKLEERNPNRVLYITGNNERRGAWYTYGLKEAIQFKAPHLTTKQNPLYKVVEKYFETLPLAVYASIPNHKSKDFVRLSHFAMEVPSKESYRDFVELLKDDFYSKELLENRQEGINKVIKLSKKRGAPDTDKVNVRVTIKSYRKTREYQENPGFRFLVPDKSASAWAAISSPTVFVHKILDFWYDAFVIVQAAPRIENWTATLYSRDIRKKEDFKKTAFNFLSGEKINSNKETARKNQEKKSKNTRRIRR